MLKGILVVATLSVASGSVLSIGPRLDPLAGPLITREENENISKLAIQKWVEGGKKFHFNTNFAGENYCGDAMMHVTRQFLVPWSSKIPPEMKDSAGVPLTETYVSFSCDKDLRAAIILDLKNQELLNREAENQKELKKKEQWKAEIAAMELEADEIAIKVEGGNRNASTLCRRKAADGYGDQVFANICNSKVNVAAAKALRAKKLQPFNCQQWSIANTREGETVANAMRVSLNTTGQTGMFSGQILQLNGGTLVIYDSASRLNAIINTDKKTIFYSDSELSIGRGGFGFGIQTGSRQVSLASGQASTISVITAKCIEGMPNY